LPVLVKREHVEVGDVVGVGEFQPSLALGLVDEVAHVFTHKLTLPLPINVRINRSTNRSVSPSININRSIDPSIKKNIYNANSKQVSTRLESVAQTVARWILSYTTERNASVILQSWTECWHYVDFIIGHNISNHGFIIAPTFSQSVYTIQITCISQHPSYKQ